MSKNKALLIEQLERFDKRIEELANENRELKLKLEKTIGPKPNDARYEDALSNYYLKTDGDEIYLNCVFGILASDIRKRKDGKYIRKIRVQVESEHDFKHKKYVNLYLVSELKEDLQITKSNMI